MLFQKMARDEREKALWALFDLLDERLFHGEFQEMGVSIELMERAPAGQYADFFECFPCPEIRFFEKPCFEAAPFCSEQTQIIFFSSIMLHEMIHLFCFVHGIEDNGDEHGEEWKAAAIEHGLKPDNCKIDALLPTGIDAIKEFAYFSELLEWYEQEAEE